MAETLHVFDFLDAPHEAAVASVCVVYGDELFLKRLAVRELVSMILGGEEEDVPFSTYDGASAEWGSVLDELSTASLFGPDKRLVVIEDGDRFVSTYRSELEDYFAAPRSKSVLVLETGAWTKTTRLAKATVKSGLPIECRAPEVSRGRSKKVDLVAIAKWLNARAKKEHDFTLKKGAADRLLDLVGVEFGMLDNALAKLALHAGPKGAADGDMVIDIVGGWQTKTAWEMIDAASMGSAAEAMLQLDRLIQDGQRPHALYGQIAWSLRRFSTAGQIYLKNLRDNRRISLPAALEKAGFNKWPQGALAKAESSMKQIGRDRVANLLSLLVETDLAMKSTHSDDVRARLALEKLFLALARRPNVA